ncbi:NUDIX hydrolase [Sphingomonas sp. MMS24-JH45]
MTPHAAAASEAEEEAGVTGAVCPVRLGSYRYRKKRGSGASLLIDVDVFPLAVTAELASWKEQHQRERRWFSLAEAAEAVDEPDLRELFAASPRRNSGRRCAVEADRASPVRQKGRVRCSLGSSGCCRARAISSARSRRMPRPCSPPRRRRRGCSRAGRTAPSTSPRSPSASMRRTRSRARC